MAQAKTLADVYAPDLTLLAFALTDAVHGGIEGVLTYRQRLHTALHRRLPICAVILLSPCMMDTRATARLPLANRADRRSILATQNAGIVDASADALRAVAGDRQVPLADAYALWPALAHDGVDTTAMLVDGIHHPFGYAHDLLVLPLMACLEQDVEEAEWRLAPLRR